MSGKSFLPFGFGTERDSQGRFKSRVQIILERSFIIVFVSAIIVGGLISLSKCAKAADVDLCATASCSNQNTTVSSWSDSTHPVLANARDYVNGQGIRFDHAGAAAASGAPSGLGVAPVGTTGSTSYLYKISAVDTNGGVSVATAAGGISNGNVDLTPNNYNDVTFTAGAGPAVGWIVWRSVNGGAYMYLKFVNNVHFWDYGITDAKPNWVPDLPPVAALNGFLVTSVVSGGGTTSPVIANAATSLLTGADAKVWHDDGVAVTTAINSLNSAGGGYNLTCPGSARIHYASTLPTIQVSDARVVGSPGCKFLPAGQRTGLTIQGGALGTSKTLAGDVIEGSIQIPLTDATGLVAGDFLVIQQLAPPTVNDPVQKYFHASPIRSIVGNTVTITDPSVVTFAPLMSSITISNSWNTGDTVTASFSGLGSATYTTVLGDVPWSVARGLAVEINALFNSSPGGSGAISAYSMLPDTTSLANPAKVILYVPGTTTTTITASRVTGSSGTISVTTNDATTAPTVNKWNPIKNVGLHNIGMDGTDSIGIGFYIFGVADWENKGLRIANMHGGAALFTDTANYSGIVEDVDARDSGSAAANFTSNADIWITQFTVLQASNLKSRGSQTFGIQHQEGGYLTANNIYSSGAQAGRGYKLEAVSVFNLSGIMANNASYTNFALAYGTRRGNVFGLHSYGGERGFLSNATCIWNADTYNALIRYFGVHSENCYSDAYESGPTDVKMSVQGAVIGAPLGTPGFGNIYNRGLTRFRDLNGYDRAGGNSTQSYQHGTPNGFNSPTPLSDYNE